MATHAQLPWKLAPTDDTSIIDTERREVCTVDGDYNSPDEWPVMEANAALIVRAVNTFEANEALIKELVEALKEAVEGWEDGAQYKSQYLREKHNDAEGIAAAEALILKAEARS